MTNLASSKEPRLAVILPIYKHSALMIEAIESILSQTFQGGTKLLLVNDGCPFAETDAACRDYVEAFPELITYLRKTNGGLANARNFGIRYILSNLLSIEAIYFLDADNRLHPDAMSRAMSMLDIDDGVDWIYPNIDMFGLEAQHDYGGPYSQLIHTAMNICEAGSLVRRRVFESGVLFDESFALGWEDWDFFLSAASRGFRGLNLENFGFIYRKRPESMLAESERHHDFLRGVMDQKHHKLLNPRSLLALEQTEAPRYAICIADRGEVICGVDPNANGTRLISLQEYELEFWRAKASSPTHRIPPFLFVMSQNLMDSLRHAGLLHWTLWKLETLLEKGSISVLLVSQGEVGRLGVSRYSGATAAAKQNEAVVVGAKFEVLSRHLGDPDSSWIDNCVTPQTTPNVVEALELRVSPTLPLLESLRRPSAFFDFLGTALKLRSSRWREASRSAWDRRSSGIPFRSNEHLIVRKYCDNSVVFPRVNDCGRHIGFLLPLAEYGGVEKVAVQVARALRDLGWRPHAFILEASDIACSEAWTSAFETTNFFADPGFSTWNHGANVYMGTTLPAWAESGAQGPLLGLLQWLDVVVNCHGGAVAGIMGRLKKLGVKTVNSVHLADLTLTGRPCGNAYLGLAYEHVFDLFAPCSRQMADWLHAIGIPSDKIIPLPNAPGFDVPDHVTARGILERESRGDGMPLNVLYLGRLDRQKGIHHLAEVMEVVQNTGLNVRWRIIGKPVVNDSAVPIPSVVTDVLEAEITDPVRLGEVYAWADVVILLSSYEGLPLVVLEGMRAGAVVVATDVGAVSEVIRNNENGILLSGPTGYRAAW